jgi:hypothetical protein
MSTPIKQSALVYGQVEKIIKTRTLADPISIKELTELIPEAKHEQQVWDAVRKYRNKGYIKRIREGASYKYWWEEHTPESKLETFVEPAPPTPVVYNGEKPELIVTPTGCTIITNRIKITIEY